MPDLEYEEIQEILSLPADAIAGQVARRRFLQGALAAGAGRPGRGWPRPGG